MPASEPGKMDAPLTFYSHGDLGEAIGVKIDHDTSTVDIFIRRPSQTTAVIKRIADPQAAWFAHLTLHRHDLSTAKQFLDEFERLDSTADDSHETACAALWVASVVTTIRCFGDSALRKRLDPDVIFGEQTPNVPPLRVDFDHVKYLRNKHISHDESNWMQAIPLAIFNDPNVTPNVVSVHGMVIRGESANADNIARLRRVIDTASAWVQTEWYQLAATLTTNLRSLDKAALAALPDVFGNLPHEGSVATNRGRTA